MIKLVFLKGGKLDRYRFEMPGVDNVTLPNLYVYDLSKTQVGRATVGHDSFWESGYNSAHEQSCKHFHDEGTLYIGPESADLPDAYLGYWPKDWSAHWQTDWATFYKCVQYNAHGGLHLTCLQGYRSDYAPTPRWGRKDFILTEADAYYDSDQDAIIVDSIYKKGVLNYKEQVGPALDMVESEGTERFLVSTKYLTSITIENWVKSSFPEHSYDIRHEVLGVVDKQFAEAHPTFGLRSSELEYQACLNAVDQLDSKINWYENIEELYNIFDTVKSVESIQKKLVNTRERLTQLFAKIREGNGKSIKAVAGTASAAYLTKKYGIDNDIRDVMALPEYRRYLDWASRSKILLHGRSGACRVRLQCQPYLSGVQHIDSLGITPSLENLWAIIPFSFAADWFSDTGDALHQIHQAYKWGNDSFHIFNYMFSYLYDDELRVQAALNFGEITAKIMGYVSRRDYERTIDAVIPDACYVNKSKGPTVGSHIIETASLIIGTCSKL
jgi:hypothetical protein